MKLKTFPPSKSQKFYSELQKQKQTPKPNQTKPTKQPTKKKKKHKKKTAKTCYIYVIIFLLHLENNIL